MEIEKIIDKAIPATAKISVERILVINDNLFWHLFHRISNLTLTARAVLDRLGSMALTI